MPAAFHLTSIRSEIEKGFNLTPDDEITLGHAVTTLEIQDGTLGTVTWCLFNAQRYADAAGEPSFETSGAARAWSPSKGVMPAITIFKSAT